MCNLKGIPAHVPLFPCESASRIKQCSCAFFYHFPKSDALSKEQILCMCLIRDADSQGKRGT